MFQPTLFKGVAAALLLYVTVGPDDLGNQSWIPERYRAVTGYAVVTGAECSGRSDCIVQDGQLLRPEYRAVPFEQFRDQVISDAAQQAVPLMMDVGMTIASHVALRR